MGGWRKGWRKVQTYDVRNLPERLFLEHLWLLVLSCRKIDVYILERDLLFMQYDRNTLRACGERESVECEDHVLGLQVGMRGDNHPASSDRKRVHSTDGGVELFSGQVMD